ncbi:chitotriosidase-1 isoform X3 [Prionailurus iriomotensis]
MVTTTVAAGISNIQSDYEIPPDVLCLALLLNAQLARPGHFKPDDIDPCLCTHLIYAFAGMRNNEITTTEWDDVTFYQAFNGLKNNFTAMVSTPENLQNFIASVIKFLRQYEFDGLDFDWEYPGSCGSPPQDKHLFTVPVQHTTKMDWYHQYYVRYRNIERLKKMRDAFEQEAKQINRPRLMVTAAVAAGISNIQCGYEILQLSQYLDYIHVMTYDLPGSWEGYTAENSPLYKYPTDKGSNAYLNVDYIMNYWKENGAPAEKLIVGFPTYGHTVILSDPSNTGIGAPTSGAGPPGPSTRQSGFWAYYEICTFLKNGATQAWDTPQDVPYAYQGNQWVGYDNVKSFDIKAQWLKENNFGGAMVWAIDLDDFTGTFCNQGQVPPDQYPEESPWTAECNGILS